MKIPERRWRIPRIAQSNGVTKSYRRESSSERKATAPMPTRQVR